MDLIIRGAIFAARASIDIAIIATGVFVGVRVNDKVREKNAKHPTDKIIEEHEDAPKTPKKEKSASKASKPPAAKKQVQPVEG